MNLIDSLRLIPHIEKYLHYILAKSHRVAIEVQKIYVLYAIIVKIISIVSGEQ
jgi:hypothetical protein